MMNDSLFQLIKVQLINRPEKSINGILLAYNENWILLKHNVVDYLIDGYSMINRKKIDYISKDAEIRFVEEVLKAKGINFHDSCIELGSNIFQTLEYISIKYGAFCLEFEDDQTCCVGRYIGHDDQDYFAFEELAPCGDWIEELDEFNVGKIYRIDFDTDYIESLLMFANKRVNG